MKIGVFLRKIFGLKDARNNHTFTDAENEAAIELHKSAAEIKRQKQALDLELYKLRMEAEKLDLQRQIESAKQALEDLTGDYEEETSGSADNVLIGLLTAIMSKNNLTSPGLNAAADSHNTQPTPQHLTDAELNNIWDNLPSKAQKYARKMNDSSLSAFIKGQMPALDDDSIKRAVLIVRGR